MYAGNPKYELKAQLGNYKVYLPTNTMEGYSTQRFVEAINQQIYSNAGANRDVLEQVMNIIVEKCNKEKVDNTLRTDISALANSILYRLKYPVDQHCAIRMGAILCFVEEETETGVVSEPEEKIETVWLNKKVSLAFTSDEAYRFFLTLGIANTEKYKEHFDTLNDLEYFSKRMEALRMTIPEAIIKQYSNSLTIIT